jgi:bifunctional non-homologous end joining protein LigD
MPESFEFCIPTTEMKVPSGPEWLHEIKYDGYREGSDEVGSRIFYVRIVSGFLCRQRAG